MSIDEMTPEKKERFNKMMSYFFEWVAPGTKLKNDYDRFCYQTIYIADRMGYLNEEN